MNIIPQSFTRNIGRKVLVAKKNSPHIFFAAGVLGVVGSTVLACRATLKLEETLDDIKHDLDNVKETHKIDNHGDAQRTHDLVYVHTKSVVRIARLYGPSLVLGSASIAALAGSHMELTRRNAALTATLGAVTTAYEEYRLRVQEEVGPEKELDIYRKTTNLKDEGTKQTVKVYDPNGLSPYARIFDETCIRWEKDAEINRLFIQCQQNYANHLLRARGHVFLNDVYDALGFERSQAGAVVGWVMNGDGDNYIDFGLFEAASNRFVNGIERSIILDFNVDGVVYDKI